MLTADRAAAVAAEWIAAWNAHDLDTPDEHVDLGFDCDCDLVRVRASPSQSPS
jgi:hypothetical protein